MSKTWKDLSSNPPRKNQSVYYRDKNGKVVTGHGDGTMWGATIVPVEWREREGSSSWLVGGFLVLVFLCGLSQIGDILSGDAGPSPLPSTASDEWNGGDSDEWPGRGIHYAKEEAIVESVELDDYGGEVVVRRGTTQHGVAWRTRFLHPTMRVEDELRDRVEGLRVALGATDIRYLSPSVKDGVTALFALDDGNAVVSSWRCADSDTAVTIASVGADETDTLYTGHREEIARLSCTPTATMATAEVPYRFLGTPNQWVLERSLYGQDKYVNADRSRQLYLGSTHLNKVRAVGCAGVASGQLAVNEQSLGLELSERDAVEISSTQCEASGIGVGRAQNGDGYSTRITSVVMQCADRFVLAGHVEIGAIVAPPPVRDDVRSLFECAPSN